MNVLAVLQARFSSSRLPGKVLKPVLGEPMIFRQIERIRKARKINKLVVATSVNCEDDVIAQMCARKNVDCYRGSLDDVLDRFYKAAREYMPKHVMRLTGDCPLFDPDIADCVVELHLNDDADYTSNVNPPTFPDGLDVEIMKFSALKRAWEEASLKSEREHVTPYLRNHPEIFKQNNMYNKDDLSGLRWTVDEPEDYEVICKVYEGLISKNKYFTFKDVLDFCCGNHELSKINCGIVRNEGYVKSLRDESKG